MINKRLEDLREVMRREHLAVGTTLRDGGRGELEQENKNINIKNRTIMKKMMNWVLAATLICCASVFTSCTNDTSDNPVPAPGKNSITVKEGAEVTPKVTVSPTSATEGQTVTLTAIRGYKFRRVEVPNASVTAEDNGQLMINKTLMTVPITWIQEEGTYLTADELPGFKPITAEEAPITI